MSEDVKLILQAVDAACFKHLVINKDKQNDRTLNDFFELCLGFESFYSFMPTRLDNFFDTVHSNIELRDFIFDIVESMTFKLLSSDNDVKPYQKVVNTIAQTLLTTKNKNQIAGAAFLSTISLGDSDAAQLVILLKNNPILVLFYVVSQNITELTTFNTLYLKDLTEGK
jgi:hypothetical protein